jgi:hypothetical protein
VHKLHCRYTGPVTKSSSSGAFILFKTTRKSTRGLRAHIRPMHRRGIYASSCAHSSYASSRHLCFLGRLQKMEGGAWRECVDDVYISICV